MIHLYNINVRSRVTASSDKNFKIAQNSLILNSLTALSGCVKEMHLSRIRCSFFGYAFIINHSSDSIRN